MGSMCAPSKDEGPTEDELKAIVTIQSNYRQNAAKKEVK